MKFEFINSSLIINRIQWIPREVVYGFDFDGTLVRTLSGKKFPSNATDVAFWNPTVPEKLRALTAQGIGIIIVTNQYGLRRDILKRLEWFLKHFDFPIKFYAATEDDAYRKPSKLIWRHFARNDNKTKQLDINKCKFVGDAAGRSQDFSCSDRKFALNVGIAFQTPEEFFNGQSPEPFTIDGFNPHSYIDCPAVIPQPTKHQELVIIVGSPASGKSTLVKKYFPTYVQINQDKLKTKKKCLTAAQQALSSGKSVIIDNTNPTSQTRAEYISIAKDVVPIRCFHVTTPPLIANHLNVLRCILGHAKKIPSIAFRVYESKFEPPTINEGFQAVIEIPFRITFENELQKKIFYQRY
jgi:bifunctional polynucleotide phosphatase/kinase